MEALFCARSFSFVLLLNSGALKKRLFEAWEKFDLVLHYRHLHEKHVKTYLKVF